MPGCMRMCRMVKKDPSLVTISTIMTVRIIPMRCMYKWTVFCPVELFFFFTLHARVKVMQHNCLERGGECFMGAAPVHPHLNWWPTLKCNKGSVLEVWVMRSQLITCGYKDGYGQQRLRLERAWGFNGLTLLTPDIFFWMCLQVTLY